MMHDDVLSPIAGAIALIFAAAIAAAGCAGGIRMGPFGDPHAQPCASDADCRPRAGRYYLCRMPWSRETLDVHAVCMAVAGADDDISNGGFGSASASEPLPRP